VLAGPNGSGKSSVFMAFDLIRAAATGKLQDTFLSLGGAHSLVTRKYGVRELEVSVRSATSNYSLSVAALIGGYEIVRESLADATTGLKLLESDGALCRVVENGGPMPSKMLPRSSALEPALAAAPPWLEQARDPLRRGDRYQPIPVHDESEVLKHQKFGLTSSPGKRGESLGAALYSLQQRNRERFALLEDSLRAVFPEFRELKFPYVGSNSMALQWSESGLSSPLELNQLSSGSIRFLWLLSILYGSDDGTLILLDEPELSLHPRLVRYLVELFREASERLQIVVATQSEMFIRCLEPAELIIAGINEDSEAQFQPAAQLDLDAWLADYSMDQLWLMGQLEPRG